MNSNPPVEEWKGGVFGARSRILCMEL